MKEEEERGECSIKSRRRSMFMLEIKREICENKWEKTQKSATKKMTPNAANFKSTTKVLPKPYKIYIINNWLQIFTQ